MFVLEKLELPKLGLAGLEAALTADELALQRSVHEFAEAVMRPIGRDLDRMAPDEVVAPGSPLFTFLRRFKDAGIVDLPTLATLPNEQKGRLMPIIFEELGWGDAGLALLGLVSSFPAFAAYTTGNPELIDRFGNVLGCWLGTQPDRGGDVVDLDVQEVHPGARQDKGNLGARVEGDEVVITGQSSAWVSGAPIAQAAFAYIPCDYGDGLYRGAGLQHIAILIPLDLAGVSKGKPVDKLGQRTLPQGELFFDDVRVPGKYVVAGKDTAIASMVGALTFGNMEMGATFTGVARAAFEHALAYVHERHQGGVKLVAHQTVRLRLFTMWQKLEAARALSRRVFAYNYGPHGPHVMASITSKTFVTQTALELANEAIQLFGGNGLTKEYPVEKLMRDARAALIEDGENTLLGLKAASWLSRWYEAQHDVH
jgi:acyl-CoA dehydrogenase